MKTVSLKIDVCTREGMRRGVPSLLEALARRRIRATFFLAFGPDCSGRAITRLLRPGFRRKMARTGALRLYGLRTALSGTLLPARSVAAGFPDLVRRIHEEGHEVALHGWNHRRWQDRVDDLSDAELDSEFERAVAAYVDVLGEPPRATGAPGWRMTSRSLHVQERLGFEYASDLRGGPPCRLHCEGSRLELLQIPTHGPVVEELLAVGVTEPTAIERTMLEAARDATPAVLGLHAEIEGGRFDGFFKGLLSRLSAHCDAVLPLRDVARTLATEPVTTRRLVLLDLPGRSDPVSSSAPCA